MTPGQTAYEPYRVAYASIAGIDVPHWEDLAELTRDTWETFAMHLVVKDDEQVSKRVYIAGPMRGIKHFNFPAFDAAAEQLHNEGWEVVSPAQIDREEGFDPTSLPDDFDWSEYHGELDLKQVILRDVEEILACDAVALLPGWKNSVGAGTEVAVANWAGIETFAFELREEDESILRPTCSCAESEQAKRRTSEQVERHHARQFGQVGLGRLAVKLGEECGELQGAVVRELERRDRRSWKPEIRSEMQDVLTVLHVIASRLGLDLQAEADEAASRFLDRRWPNVAPAR